MAKPGITSSSKLRLPWKWIAGAGVVGAGLFALSQCDGNETEQAAPVDTNKPYYQIINDARIGKSDSPDKGYGADDPAIVQGSCVQGVVDSAGKQKEGDRMYFVRAEDADGKVKEGYVFMGHIGEKALDSAQPGFTCKAQFMTASRKETPEPVTPTYIANQTVNLRDGGSMEAPIWGTLAKGSCVTYAGSRAGGGLMQVGIATARSAPDPVQYMWVKADQMQQSATPPEKCVATFTVGAEAGITPRF